MKFHILVFGCQMNYADSARIKVVLINCGFVYTEKMKDADIVIFHTCSVRQKSEDKITGKLKATRPDQKVWITGCMIQHTLRQAKIHNKEGSRKVGNFLGSLTSKTPKVIGYTADEIHHIKESDQSSEMVSINHAFNPLFHNLTQKRKNIELMRRIDDTGFLPLVLERLGYTIAYDKEIINEYEKIIPENIQTSMNKHKKTAYIPISTGCNQFCSYCIVPYARGLERHFSLEHIVNEANIHIKNGAEEIVLLGQIVNKHPDFVQILKEILKIEGLKWLRYTSPYPTFYDKELLTLHEKEEKLCPHIHMPLQSGSDSVLKKMFRGYTVAQAKEFIDNIKNLKRDISITTDIIVGFPDETEDDFQKTLDLVVYGNFDMIYIGIYSPRPGTFAEKNNPDNISRAVKRERWKKLNETLISLSRHNNEKEIGTKKTILINKIHKKDAQGVLVEGYTENMKQVLLQEKEKPHYKVGDFIQAKITKAIPFKLYAEMLK